MRKITLIKVLKVIKKILEGSHIINKTIEKWCHSNVGNVIGNIKMIPILLENKIWLTRLVEWGLQFFSS